MTAEFPKQLFEQGLKELSLTLPEEDKKGFEKYFHLLREWNERTNLTAITDPEGIVLKHFIDSLTCLPHMDRESPVKAIDVGTGAGFPGVPLKLAVPRMELTLVESNNKKVKFLEALVEELGLKGVQVIWKRAEEVGQDRNHREQYDLMLSRALAPLPVILEYGLPLLKTGGTLLAMKSQKSDEEIDASQKALKLLGGKLEAVHDFELPVIHEPRRITLFKKTGSTPSKYPRQPGLPGKKPL